MPTAMDIDAEHKNSDNLPDLNASYHTILDIPDSIQELQMELEQLTKETWTFTQHKLLPQQKTNHHHSSATWF